MISALKFYGDSTELTTSGVAALLMNKRVHLITANSPGNDVRLPDARKMKKGWPVFVLVNVGSNSFDVQDNTGAVLLSGVTSTQAVLVGLLNESTQAGIWQLAVRTKKT